MCYCRFFWWFCLDNCPAFLNFVYEKSVVFFWIVWGCCEDTKILLLKSIQNQIINLLHTKWLSCNYLSFFIKTNLFRTCKSLFVSIDISSFNFHSIKLDPLSHTDNTPNNWPGMAAEIKIQTLKNLWFVWSYSMVEDCIWHICVSTESFST